MQSFARSSTFILAMVCWMPTSVLAEVPTVTATGQVVDGNGDPVAGAKVLVVGNRSYPRPSHSHTGFMTGVTDERGEFAIGWPKTDRRFLQSPDVSIVAYDGDGSMAMTRMRLAQMIAGLTARVNMIDPVKQPVRIVDESGGPVVGARVSTARIGSQTVPFAIIDESGTGQSDDRGAATFAGVTSPLLKQVYVTGSKIGNHRVEVTTDADGQRVAVIRRGHALEGQLRWSDSGAPPTKLDWSGLQLTFVAGQRGESTYTWSDVAVSSSGTFTTDPLVPESTIVVPKFAADMPFALDEELFIGIDRFASSEPIEIPIRWATRVHGKIIDGADGSPVAGVLVQTYDDYEAVFSDTDGTFTTLHSSDRPSYYPTDVFGDRVMGSDFFVYPQELAIDHQVSTAPVSIQPMSSAVGRVVDEAGSAVSGATIRCEYKIGRFGNAIELYSDRDGRFEFPGVTDGSAVTLSAMTNTSEENGLMTQEPTSLVLSADASPVLVVKPRYGLRVRGRVVDSSGQPVQDAIVQVRYAELSEPENYSGPSYQAVNAFEFDAPITTDAEGRFASPATMNWQRKFSVQIQAPAKRTLATYWKDAARAGQSASDLDLGTLSMIDQPAQRTRTLRVVDGEDGRAIESARLVFLSGLHGRATARTGNDGAATLSVRDGLQLMGVAATGYRTQAISVELGTSDLPPIRLSPLASGSPPERTPVKHDATRLREATKRLLTQVAPPFQNDTTHRAQIYYTALAFADFETTLATVKMLGGKNVFGNEALGQALTGMDWLTPEQIQTAMPLADERSRLFLTLMQAGRSKDADKRLEYLGEAIVLARGQTGDDHLYAVGAVVDGLLMAGELDVAKDLLVETYELHPELAETLETGERKKMTGVARFFTPLYALIDYDAAMRLIELTASNGETGSTQAKAMVYVASQDPEGWRAIRKRDSIDAISSDAFMWFRMRFPWSNFDAALQTLEQIDERRKLVAWVQVLESDLKHADGRAVESDERLRLIREAVPMIDASEYEYDAAHASIQATKLAKVVADMDRELAEMLVFEAMWNCDLGPTIIPMEEPARLAGELAGYDEGLARALLTPMVADWSFLFGQYDQGYSFQSNGIIAAAARIDPDWAIELCRDLGERYFGDEPARKYETIKSIFDAWVGEVSR